jgi:hypothetical protein
MLGWTPQTFWDSTPKEYLLAVEGYSVRLEQEDARIDILMKGIRRNAFLSLKANGYKGSDEQKLMPLHSDKKPKVGTKKFDLSEEEIKNRLGRKIKNG